MIKERKLASKVLHEGLLTVPFTGEQRGLYWLRVLVNPAGSCVVIITDVTGNPGPSAVNAIEEVCEQVAGSVLDGCEAHWITSAEPAPDLSSSEQFTRVAFSAGFQRPKWSTITRRQVERLAGGKLPPLPDSLTEQVLAAGGRLDEPEQVTYRVIDVTDLPLPDLLWKCRYSARFQALLDAHSQDEVAAAAKFFTSLTKAERDQCRYHQADWKAAADRAVEMINRLGPIPDNADLDAALGASKLPNSADKCALYSFFREAIVIGDGGYTNGQHRGCALRFSGARRVVVAG